MTKTQRVHLGFMIFWILMAVPTLTLWHSSILLVLIMSLYANIEASAAAFLSAPDGHDSVPKRLRTTNMSHGKGSMGRGDFPQKAGRGRGRSMGRYC